MIATCGQGVPAQAPCPRHLSGPHTASLLRLLFHCAREMREMKEICKSELAQEACPIPPEHNGGGPWCTEWNVACVELPGTLLSCRQANHQIVRS